MARAMLVSIDHADGIAAVYRDGPDGPLLLAVDLEDDDPAEIEGYMISLIESERFKAVGGLAPADAATASVRGVAGDRRSAIVGEGTWLLVTPREDGFNADAVLFRDGVGEIVRIPQPPGTTAEQIADAAEHCPACEQRVWDLVTRPEREPWQPERMIVCRTCGHEALAYFGPRPKPPELPLPDGVRRAGEAVGKLVVGALGAVVRRSVERADFPLYGLDAAWRGGRFSGSTGYDGLRLFTTDLVHGDPTDHTAPFVVVSTASDVSERMTPEALAPSTLREALNEMAPETRVEVPENLSDPARRLRAEFAVREREAGPARRVAGASRSHHVIPVDGEPVRFAAVESGELWAAACHLGQLDVTLVAQGVHPREIALVQISDLSPYFDG